jgi:hypothetical protein
MPEPLIGLLYLTQATHPQWEHQYPEDDRESVPRTAWLPQLAVAGLPFALFACALLRKASAENTAEPVEASAHPEDAYFEVEPEELDEADGACRVRAATCSCGHAECGSNSAWVTREERNGVSGLLFTNWDTREDPRRPLPLPPIFVPFAAWPLLVEGQTSRVSALLRGGKAAEEGRVRWQENRLRMVAAARQAAVGLTDPWGRSLELDEWSAEHLQERKHRQLMLTKEQRYRRSPAGLLAQYEQEMQACDQDEASARQGLCPGEIVAAGGLAFEPDPLRVNELLQRIDARRARARQVFQEELLPPRERRIARRARARASKERSLALYLEAWAALGVPDQQESHF